MSNTLHTSCLAVLLYWLTYPSRLDYVEPMNNAIRSYLSDIGQRGGQSRSVAKVTAARLNSREAGRPGKEPRPDFIPRTAEMELHLMPGLLARHGSRDFMATEKLDGFSFSFGLRTGDFFMAARDRAVRAGERSVFAAAAKALGLESVLRAAGLDNFILQAELIGPGIRGNRYGLSDLQLHCFNLLTIGSGFEPFSALETFCHRLDLHTVPVIERNLRVSEATASAACTGQSQLHPTAREGAVFRPLVETTDPMFGRVSFKVFNPGFIP